MDNIIIKEYADIDMSQIVDLYSSAGWINYTNNLPMLEQALKNSLKIFAAFHRDKLIGIIRVVGDGYSIIYIQDIIVLPEYQRQGIGKALIGEVDNSYGEAYQKVLLTDDSPQSKGFYENCGFSPGAKFNCTAFVKFHTK